jgi:hypothetical protein
VRESSNGAKRANHAFDGTADPGHHHFASETVHFYMNDEDRRVRCGISRLALEVLEPEVQRRKAVCRRPDSIDAASSVPPAPSLTADS